MNVLVTGGGGFLGLYVVEQLLARGDRVRSFSRRCWPALQALGVKQIQGDLQDPKATVAACYGMETVFHAAGVAGVWGPWKHYYGINTLGTQNIVSGCLSHGVKRLIYTSSPSVTFDGRDQCGINESAPYPRRWLCHYPHSKALAEQHVLEADGQRGLQTCSLRPHLIWGPRDDHLIPRLLDRARRGKLRQVGDGRNLIDMIYVENAATAHLQAADCLVAGSPVCGQAYFISQGEPVNCWQWINRILALAGLPEVKKSISLKAAWALGSVLEVANTLLLRKAEPVMTRFVAAQLGTSHYFDIQRSQDDFGYTPLISTTEGMQRLARELQG